MCRAGSSGGLLEACLSQRVGGLFEVGLQTLTWTLSRAASVLRDSLTCVFVFLMHSLISQHVLKCRSASSRLRNVDGHEADGALSSFLPVRISLRSLLVLSVTADRSLLHMNVPLDNVNLSTLCSVS